MPRLLLVEDDEHLSKKLVESLTKQNYIVEAVSSGSYALQLLDNFEFDAIILDWNLTDITGIDVCRQYRDKGGKTPILFLTGYGELSMKEHGLDSGADDYMVKPFEIRELMARLRSLMRRPPLTTTELSAKGLKLEVESRTIIDGQQSVRLSPRESGLLEYLMRHPNRPYTSRDLLNHAWPLDTDASEETVRACLKTLRHKLAKIGREDLIKTQLGYGYVLEV
jgi:OmpR-family two-component system manganese-sensing response regulator